MRHVKFRPKRVSIHKDPKDPEDDTVEIVFEKGRHSHAFIFRDSRWKNIFKKIFEDDEDSRAYDITAVYECYITEHMDMFRVCGLRTRNGQVAGLSLHQVIDKNGKIWKL